MTLNFSMLRRCCMLDAAGRGAMIAVALAVTPPVLHAEITETSAVSLKSKNVLLIAASPQRVYQTLIRVASWWDPEHTYSGQSGNLSLTAKPGGCFCEKLSGGGGVLHMTVVYVAPNQRLTLSGALGPLQTAGLAGALTFQLVAKPAGTELAVVYNVGGYYPGGLASVAAGVDEVLLAQAQRLKAVAETGEIGAKRAAKAHP
jgi:uncharacterized protein YndB with AHSA1/START domain